MWFTWFTAIAAAILVLDLTKKVATSMFRGGHKSLGRLIMLLRLPVCAAVVWNVYGKGQHDSAATLAWHGLEAFAGGMAGQVGYMFCKATFRTYRILRTRRTGALP